METMTLAEARKQRLEVYFPANPEAFAKAFRDCGRTAIIFEEKIAGFTIRVVAVGPRPQAGQTACEVKKHKTVRQFIQEE